MLEVYYSYALEILVTQNILEFSRACEYFGVRRVKLKGTSCCILGKASESRNFTYCAIKTAKHH